MTQDETERPTEALEPIPVPQALPVVSAAQVRVAQEVWGDLPSPEELLQILKSVTHLMKAGIFPKLENITQGAVKVIHGRDFGLGCIPSLMYFDIVEGQFYPRAKLLAALVTSQKRFRFQVVHHDDTRCELQWYDDGRPVGRSWYTIEEAAKAGKMQTKSGRPGAWQLHTPTMLYWRAMSRGVNWFAPHLEMGRGFLEKMAGRDDDVASLDGTASEPVHDGTDS